MYIQEVISYKNSWQKLLSQHSDEFDDILWGLNEFFEYYKDRDQKRVFLYSDRWSKILMKRGWQKTPKELYYGGSKLNVSDIGPVKNGISASIKFTHTSFINRWLFQQSAIGVKYQISQIPILLVPTEEYARRSSDLIIGRGSWIELILKQIQPLSPLSHSYPFLILGYSDQQSLFGTNVIELESDPLLHNSEIIIDRSIEFPPEFYQAGLNILSFFGTYLREQYPNEDAKVKIEQDGHLVRLIIETNDGEKEIIEKALGEYQLIVTGQRLPEQVTTNQKLILELRNELRLAQFRIESQNDIIQFQRNQVDDYKQLLHTIANGLSTKTPVNVEVNPIFNLNNNNISMNDYVSYAIAGLTDLKQLIPASSQEYAEIQDLEQALKILKKRLQRRLKIQLQ